MDEDTFWQIIETSHHTSMEVQEKKLRDNLSQLSEKEILEFLRLVSLRYWELYSWDLWGVAYLYWGGCLDDGFMDWRYWIIYCGKDAFETARDRPDDLVPIIDAHPSAGCEGIGYVADKVLVKKNPKWEHASPDFQIPHPSKPRGEKWKKADLERRLPKAYERFTSGATESERRMRDPDYVKQTFGVKLGEERVYTIKSEEIEIGEQNAIQTHFIPTPKKPWWKFW